MSDKKEPGVKEFLIYLVKKRILPKEAVARCRQRKQEALDKGYSLPIKDILLELGHIASESEYQKLWDDMKEEHRIRSKIEEKEAGESNLNIPEEVLDVLISKGQVAREQFPGVPTAVIEAANSQWGKKKAKRDHFYDAARHVTQIIRNTGYAAMANPVLTWLWVAAITSLLSSGITIGYHYWLWYRKPYHIQEIQLQIPAPPKHTTRIQPGEPQIKNLSEFRQLLMKEGLIKQE